MVAHAWRPRHQRANGDQQGGRVDWLALGLPVPRQLRPQRVAGLQQHVDHRGVGREFVAAQLVEQGFHLVRQLGHVGKAEGGRAALDRMRAAEDGVQLIVSGGSDVDL